MKSIVACVDLSAATSPVLETATTLSTALGAKLCLLHIAQFGRDVEPTFTKRRVRRQLRELCEPLQSHGLETCDILVKTGNNPAMEILAECERIEPDLIVIGSHGRGAAYQLLVGSTAEGVLRKAKCPVVMVPTARDLANHKSAKALESETRAAGSSAKSRRVYGG